MTEQSEPTISKASEPAPASENPDPAIPPAAARPAARPQKPSIGRIVHYTNLGDRDGKYPPMVQAAIITGVNDENTGNVALHVFYKTGQFDLGSCDRTDAAAGSEDARGKWCWPERQA